MFIKNKSFIFGLLVFQAVFFAACHQGQHDPVTHGFDTEPTLAAAANGVQSRGLEGDRHVLRKDSANMQIKGKLDASRQVVLVAGNSSISIRAPKCIEEVETLKYCSGEIELLIQIEGKATQRIVASSLFFDSSASLYRGPLHAGAEVHRHSLILSDVNNDGIEDLLVWSGKEGAYGGPSFDVYLMRASTGQFELSKEYSELTIGYNGLFEVDGNLIKTVASSGCCMHIFETYEIRQGKPVLVERVTEDNTDPAKPLKTKEALVDGVLQTIM